VSDFAHTASSHREQFRFALLFAAVRGSGQFREDWLCRRALKRLKKIFGSPQKAERIPAPHVF